MRTLFVALFAAVFTTASFAADAPTSAPSKKLNILFIAVDDLRPELGCYGSPIKSPNIDALASRGLVFDRAYCQQAVCSPSRTSMLTGRRPDTTKVYDLTTHFRSTIPDVVTLPQYFKQNGYHTQSFGKIYHGKLDDPASWSVPHTPNEASQYSDPKIIEALKDTGADMSEVGGKTKGPAWEIADCPDSQLPDGFIAGRAIAAMKQVKDKPFFLAVGFMKPHLPFVAPRRFFEMYPLDSVKLSPNPNPPTDVPHVAMTNFEELRAYTNIAKGRKPIEDEQARELRRGYFASVSWVDSQIGRVLDQLDQLGLRDSTIVIIWGDHGWHLGDNGLWTKHTNFEIAARAAMIFSTPGMKHPGSKTEALMEYVDIYPTLCELAGLAMPGRLEGTSFVPLLDDPARAWKKAAFSQFPRPNQKAMGYSMRTDRYRYTEWQSTAEKGKVDARELYDQQTDPLETKNVADKPENAEIVKQLSAQLARGWKAAGP